MNSKKNFNKLKVVLVADCERFISFSQVNPRWNKYEKFKGKINSAIKNFRYNKNGIELLIETLKEERFPATLMFVQKIFREKPKLPKFIEVGYHTKNHLPLTLISDDKLDEEIENVWKVKSFTAPMWMVEDRCEPSRIYKRLNKQGYTHTVYRGENEGVKHWHHNSVEKPSNKSGIKAIHVSACFEGNSKKEHIEKIKEEILFNLQKDKVFLLSTHDFTHKNNKNLLSMINFLKDLEQKNKIKVLRLSDL